MLKHKTLFILFIVAPLSPYYSDHPSALRLLHLIDAGLIQNLVLNNVLCQFLPCYTSFTTHHALCHSHNLMQEFDENVCQKPQLGLGQATSHEWQLWLGPALKKAKATAFGPSQAGHTNHLTNWKFFFQIYLVRNTLLSYSWVYLFFPPPNPDAYITQSMGLMMWPCAIGMWILYMSQQGLGFYNIILVYNKWTNGYKGYTTNQLTHFVQVGQCM